MVLLNQYEHNITVLEKKVQGQEVEKFWKQHFDKTICAKLVQSWIRVHRPEKSPVGNFHATATHTW